MMPLNFEPVAKGLSMRFLAVLAAALPGMLSAETITFENDEQIMIVRGVQMLSHANFELLGNKDVQIQCVAMDANGKPLYQRPDCLTRRGFPSAEKSESLSSNDGGFDGS